MQIRSQNDKKVKKRNKMKNIVYILRCVALVALLLPVRAMADTKGERLLERADSRNMGVWRCLEYVDEVTCPRFHFVCIFKQYY